MSQNVSKSKIHHKQYLIPILFKISIILNKSIKTVKQDKTPFHLIITIQINQTITIMTQSNKHQEQPNAVIDTKDNSCFYKEKFHMKKDHKVTHIKIINCKINLKVIKKEYKIIIVKCQLLNCQILNDQDHKIKHKKIYRIDLF